MGTRIILIISAVLAASAGAALAEPDKAKGPFHGTVHAVGTLSYKDSTAKTWTWDRGKITAVSAEQITLLRRDKVSVSLAITSATVVRNLGSTYGLADLKPGLAATVISQNGAAVVIRRLRGEGAPSGTDQSAFEGPAAKSVTGTIDAQHVDGSHELYDYDAGRITEVGQGELTIERADGEELTFTYDSETVVRHGNCHAGTTAALKTGQAGRFFSQDGLLKLVRCAQRPGKGRRQAEKPDKAERGAESRLQRKRGGENRPQRVRPAAAVSP